MKEIPSAPGCYLLYYKNEAVYVGESMDLHRRLIRLRNTPHTARERIAELFMKQSLEEKDKRITDFMEKNMEVAFLEIDQGRTELEEWIIEKLNPVLNQNKKKKK